MQDVPRHSVLALCVDGRGIFDDSQGRDYVINGSVRSYLFMYSGFEIWGSDGDRGVSMEEREEVADDDNDGDDNYRELLTDGEE